MFQKQCRSVECVCCKLPPVAVTGLELPKQHARDPLAATPELSEMPRKPRRIQPDPSRPDGLRRWRCRIVRVVRGLCLLLAFLAIPQSSRAQADAKHFAWPKGARGAVSLTFDDARSSQIDPGLAVLDRLGAKATFYVVPVRVAEDLAGWKRLAASGYEIGNHSLRHPCTGNFSWSREAALEDYTLDRMRTELMACNRQLKEMLGVEPVTFAYPCGQTFVGRGRSTRSYVPVVAQLFLAGRGWLDETPNDPVFVDTAQVSGMSMDGLDFPEVKAMVESAREAGYWLVLAGHEIGHSGRQTTRVSMLERLVPYLRDPENEIWFETVGVVARYVRGLRELQESDSPSPQ